MAKLLTSVYGKKKKNASVSDIQCPSVYVLLILVDEGTCFNQQHRRLKTGRKIEQRYRERVGNARQQPISPIFDLQSVLPVGCTG